MDRDALDKLIEALNRAQDPQQQQFSDAINPKPTADTYMDRMGMDKFVNSLNQAQGVAEYGPKEHERSLVGIGDFVSWLNGEQWEPQRKFMDKTPYYESPPETPSAPEGLRLSGNMSDRRMENHPLIGKLARQRTRGERMQDASNVPAWDEQVNSGKPTAMFDNDIEATISEGRYGEYGWLDDYIEQMARIARGEK
jgi:hypothetical protein